MKPQQGQKFNVSLAYFYTLCSLEEPEGTMSSDVTGPDLNPDNMLSFCLIPGRVSLLYH